METSVDILVATATFIPALWPVRTTEMADVKALCKAYSMRLSGRTALSHPWAWDKARQTEGGQIQSRRALSLAVGQSTGPGVQGQVQHQYALWSWQSHIVSLSLSFPIL